MSPFVIIIFGATGDLVQHKILPALFSLFRANQLGEKFYIIGFARREFSKVEFRRMLTEEWQIGNADKAAWKAFVKNIYYQQGFFEEISGYEQLINKLNSFDQEIGACITRLFYLATPPDFYLSIIKHLKKTKLSQGCGQGSEKWTKLAIEKPFGKNLATAREIDLKLSEVFEERQIYRVDHYLAKETVQNMIAFRFANGIFEPVWNKKYIDHVQITFAEKKGIGNRGKFFDGVGMLRDVAQNHLLQLLATITMEQPLSFTKESVRDARTNAIKSIRCIKPFEVSQFVVRGQYNGYLAEKHVARNSKTETFVAMKLFMEANRFEGVPFYLRAGKSLMADMVDIKIVFIQTCHLLFKEYGCPEIGNVLTIRIQPDEGIGLRVIAKKPSIAISKEGKPGLGLATVNMDFSYMKEFKERRIEAYEKLLLDILAGDQMLFNRSDELETSWQFISGILDGWEKDHKPLPEYDLGNWGPKEAFGLIERDGRKWL